MSGPEETITPVMESSWSVSIIVGGLAVVDAEHVLTKILKILIIKATDNCPKVETSEYFGLKLKLVGSPSF